MTEFHQGEPQKDEYRRYIIKNTKIIDDVSAVFEIVCRRYRKLLKEGKCLPDLILIDGGKPQLNSALKALKSLGLKNKDLVSLAKQNEEVFLPGEKKPIALDKASPALHLLQLILKSE